MTAILADNESPTWHLEASPLFKWAGGKRSLLSQIIPRLPARPHRYLEPMVGGGAVFFAYSPNAQTSQISDINQNLISAYNAIAEDPDVVYHTLEELVEEHGKSP